MTRYRAMETKKHCFMCRGFRLVRMPGSWRDGWNETLTKCPMCKRRTRSRHEMNSLFTDEQRRRFRAQDALHKETMETP